MMGESSKFEIAYLDIQILKFISIYHFHLKLSRILVLHYVQIIWLPIYIYLYGPLSSSCVSHHGTLCYEPPTHPNFKGLYVKPTEHLCVTPHSLFQRAYTTIIYTCKNELLFLGRNVCSFHSFFLKTVKPLWQSQSFFMCHNSSN